MQTNEPLCSRSPFPSTLTSSHCTLKGEGTGGADGRHRIHCAILAIQSPLLFFRSCRWARRGLAGYFANEGINAFRSAPDASHTTNETTTLFPAASEPAQAPSSTPSAPAQASVDTTPPVQPSPTVQPTPSVSKYDQPLFADDPDDDIRKTPRCFFSSHFANTCFACSTILSALLLDIWPKILSV
eukprot:m.613140 g.613140  ORF g.613140 m.613140 type:complete len:185 (-) comp58147_c0_seq51:2138-2692(-)